MISKTYDWNGNIVEIHEVLDDCNSKYQEIELDLL